MKDNFRNIDLDDLDIMDLDEEDAVYTDIDFETPEEEASEEDFAETDERMAELDEEFMEEEPYVVPVVEDLDIDEIPDETMQEYDDAEEAFERADSKGEDDGDEKAGFFAGFLDRLIHMDTMDKVIAALGGIVVVLAVVALCVFSSYRASEGQLTAFADSGKNIDNITLIGESGLLAVTDSTIAKIDALNELEDDNEEEEEDDDKVSSIVVKLNFTSIQKDLKIKFTNKKTGKLIAGIPFELDVESPSGKNLTWTDEDKDGIIYYKNIESGKYKITLRELEGEIYERYILDTATQSATVKKEIAYEQVDVSDEIKDESEIDASKEDTELGNTVESALTDTVAWVPSKVEAGGKDYVEVKKADIVAPTTTTRVLFNNNIYVMMMIAQDEGGLTPADPNAPTEPITPPETTTVTVTGLAATATVSVGGTTALTATASDSSAINWTSADSAIATVDGNGNVTGVAAGSTTITATSVNGGTPATCTVTVTAPVQTVAVTLDKTTAEVKVGKTVALTATVTGTDNVAVTWASSDTTVATVDANGVVTGVKEGTATITVTSQADTTKTATCSITVKAASVASSITLDKTTAEVEIGKEIELKATTTPSAGVSVKWTSSDETIATVKDGKVKGVKAGKVTITAALVENGSETVKINCSVTVTEVARKVTLDETKLEMTVGEEKTLKATVEGYTTASNGKVEWTSSDKTIATVDEKGNVIALKAGNVKITATNTENNVKVEAVCEITIKEGVVLKTKDGAEVFVLKGEKYVKATAADYAKNDVKFYIYTDTYKYQGWQTIDGKMYYYTADYKKVTGEQVIMGAKYVFDADGVLTSTTGVMGIDVSKWNGTIDWNQVKASGVNYVIIRCGYRGSSQGALIEDPKYKANIAGATKAGLKVGVYFFSQAVDEVEAVQEASMVLSLVKGYKISYPIFLDVEASGGRADNISKETRTAVCKAFCQTIQNSGYTAGVYANKTWLTNKIDTSQLGSYKIWLAQYAAAPTYTGRYEIWQYKDSGSVPGISGHVDLNLSYLGY